jgi:hypothetical protein
MLKTATRAAYLYAALSRACHYHSCELAPTAAELTRWLNETADLARADVRVVVRRAIRLSSVGVAVGSPHPRFPARWICLLNWTRRSVSHRTRQATMTVTAAMMC